MLWLDSKKKDRQGCQQEHRHTCPAWLRGALNLFSLTRSQIVACGLLFSELKMIHHLFFLYMYPMTKMYLQKKYI